MLMDAPPRPRCEVDDCQRERSKRAWCDLHYERWRQHGDPLAVKRAANGTYSGGGKPCTAEGCDLAAVTSGYCGKHYQRFLKYGDALIVQKIGRRPQPRRECSIEGCERTVVGRGWCERHYRRWQKHGDPEMLTGTLKGDANWIWKGESASYKAKHHRVQRLRGRADSCVWGCKDDFRYEWANLTGNYDDPYDFAAMCVLCHRRYDRARIATEAHLA